MRMIRDLMCVILLTVILTSISYGATKMDVGRWLSEIKMEQYAKNFADNAIDNKELLVSLTEDDLESIGVSALGHRREIMSAISALKSQAATAPQTEAASEKPALSDKIDLSALGDQKEKLLSALSALKNQSAQTSQPEPASLEKPAIPPTPLTNDVVVEVHQSHSGTDLWYHVGAVDPSSRTISWGQSHKYDKGRIPSIGF